MYYLPNWTHMSICWGVYHMMKKPTMVHLQHKQTSTFVDEVWIYPPTTCSNFLEGNQTSRTLLSQTNLKRAKLLAYMSAGPLISSTFHILAIHWSGHYSSIRYMEKVFNSANKFVIETCFQILLWKAQISLNVLI